jgi:hypothetical protein
MASEDPDDKAGSASPSLRRAEIAPARMRLRGDSNPTVTKLKDYQRCSASEPGDAQ